MASEKDIIKAKKSIIRFFIVAYCFIFFNEAYVMPLMYTENMFIVLSFSLSAFLFLTFGTYVLLPFISLLYAEQDKVLMQRYLSLKKKLNNYQIKFLKRCKS